MSTTSHAVVDDSRLLLQSGSRDNLSTADVTASESFQEGAAIDMALRQDEQGPDPDG